MFYHSAYCMEICFDKILDSLYLSSKQIRFLKTCKWFLNKSFAYLTAILYQIIIYLFAQILTSPFNSGIVNFLKSTPVNFNNSSFFNFHQDRSISFSRRIFSSISRYRAFDSSSIVRLNNCPIFKISFIFSLLSIPC